MVIGVIQLRKSNMAVNLNVISYENLMQTSSGTFRYATHICAKKNL